MEETKHIYLSKEYENLNVDHLLFRSWSLISFLLSVDRM